MAKKVTNGMIRKRLYDTVGDEYTLISDYVSGTTKVDLLHSKCGNIYSVTPNHFFYDNSRCKCQLNIKQPEMFEEEFNKLAKGRYTQLEAYRRSHSKISIRHEDCGTVFQATPHSFLQGKGCPECFGNRAKTTEEFSKEVDELSDGEYSLLTEYINNRTHVTIEHIECGKEYSVTPKDFLRGNRCPFCKQSKGGFPMLCMEDFFCTDALKCSCIRTIGGAKHVCLSNNRCAIYEPADQPCISPRFRIHMEDVMEF